MRSLVRGYNDTRMSDLYGVLGVPRTASAAEVKHAFRQAARRYHPDAAGGADAARFTEVHAAYETLADPAARRAYDETLPSAELERHAPSGLAAPARPPRFDPPRRGPATQRWRLARALEAYRFEPRPAALAVDVIAW